MPHRPQVAFRACCRWRWVARWLGTGSLALATWAGLPSALHGAGGLLTPCGLTLEPVPGQPGRMELGYGPTVPEFSYTVESSTDLAAGNWAPLHTFVQNDDGVTRRVVDYDAGGQRRFYRLSVDQPTLGLFWNASPQSTLLPAGATSVAFTVNTSQPGDCRYAVGSALPFAAMTPFITGQGSTAHGVTFVGLDPTTTVVNDVYVRCDTNPTEVLHLRYRALPEVSPSFPRKGNLWGSWQVFKNGGLEHCKRIDLWLGASFTVADLGQLRALNPHVLVLDSINTVEQSDANRLTIPDGYWLKDTSGKRIEVWDGTYRLNLTKPEVAAFQARYAYQKMVDAGLSTDGIFFDNFFTAQSWLKKDMWGNSVQVDANEDGLPDDPAWLDAAWRAGVYAELQIWRRLMPYAYATGHLANPATAETGALFNGNAIVFQAPQTKDGNRSFADLWESYQSWWQLGRAPLITLVESAPPFEIGYGYGYSPSDDVPASTLDFAQHFYPYMRFGLGVTLMNDGYFAHEFGDTWHGNDWWYDELDAELGRPSGAAVRVDLGTPPSADGITNGGFEQPLATGWTYWANPEAGAAATFSRETAAHATGSASCCIAITNAGSRDDWHIALFQPDRQIVKGVAYELRFFAKADAPHDFSVMLQKGSPDWRNFGLSKDLKAGPEWMEYTVVFEALETANDARLGFNVGTRAGTFWVDEVRLVQHPPDVYRRDFDNGIVLLNGTGSRRTITLDGGPFHRLNGSQAPKFQYVVDDASPAFSAGAWSEAAYDSGQWVATGPWYHDWGTGCHQLSGSAGSAEWELGVRADDTYTLDVWWPAALAATGWSTQVRYEVVVGGSVVASATLDQTTGGDQWHRLASVALTQAIGAKVRITNLQNKPAIADAVLVQSAARYNDGTPAATVELDPFDAIVLLRD
ncbi:MAG: carbohydrate binding domain-containing protein [Opitutaceae bacterium]|nr:carbohydrate binding domain-containing protein [Opitutaceae bacterium]